MGGAGQHRAKEETFVAVAATAGNVAEEGARGPNGPLYCYLISALEVPNLDIHDVFRLVRGKVREATQGRQVPWTSGSIETRSSFADRAQPCNRRRLPRAADVVSVIGKP